MPTLRIISELLFQYLTKVSNPLVLLQGAHGYNVLAASRHLKQKRALKKQASYVAAYGNFIVALLPGSRSSEGSKESIYSTVVHAENCFCPENIAFRNFNWKSNPNLPLAVPSRRTRANQRVLPVGVAEDLFLEIRR
jgi:hypothetical protein